MDILKEFGVDPLLLAAQVVNFSILLFLLKRFLYGPILKVLDTRKRKIEESLKNAEEIEQRLTKVNEDIEKMLAKTIKEEEKIIAEAKETATRMIAEQKGMSEELLSKARVQATQIIHDERVKLEAELKSNFAGVVAISLEKVLGKKVTTDQRKVLEEAIKSN